MSKMADKDEDNQHHPQVHVVLIPWLAFGHIMPLFNLSIALAKAGVHSSFVSTTRNIQRLPILPPAVAGMMNLVGLRRAVIDPSLLPEDAEATMDIPFEKVQYLKTAFDLLKDQFEEFILMAPKPNWIIADVIMPSWLVETAEKRNIPIITLYPYTASLSVFSGPPEVLLSNEIRSSESLTVKPPWVEFPSTVAYKKYEAADIYTAMYKKDASGLTGGQRIGTMISGSKAIAIRTCHEFESEFINLFSKLTSKVVIPIGFLPPELSTSPSDQVVVRDDDWKETFKWLDEQGERSIVFVGFGSECKLTHQQVHLIAGGLELSGMPFLWALREPTWAADVDDVLPLGFTTRVANRGVVQIGSWAPQKEILAHRSINCSFFHAGWGSIIESLQHGHCLVVLPFIYDQCLNARVLVEKGLAIEVERNEEDGSFVEQDIANALISAMLSSQGETLRDKCRAAASIFGNSNLNDRYIRCFADYLRNETLENTSHMIIKHK